MPQRLMNTKEVARYLGINEKKIYTLVTGKGLPATKITGKWIFFKDLVDDWLERSMGGEGRIPLESRGLLMITGSDDILFTRLTTLVRKQTGDVFPFFCKTGSTGGMFVLKDGRAHMAGSHLLDEGSNDYNIPFIDSHLGDCHLVTVNFAAREQGILVKRGNPLKIRAIEDIARKGCRLVNRQPGSGTRALLDLRLKKAGIPHKSVRGYGDEVTTHLDVGLAVLKGKAGCGLAIKAVANMLGLEFIPLVKERFDLVVLKSHYFSREVVSFLDILQSDRFRKMARALGGYDTRLSGKILYDS